MMHRTRAAHLIPRGLAGDEAEQVENISQGDPGSDLGKVDARHGSDSQGRVISGWRLTEPRGRGTVGIREEEPVSESRRPESKAIIDYI